MDPSQESMELETQQETQQGEQVVGEVVEEVVADLGKKVETQLHLGTQKQATLQRQHATAHRQQGGAQVAKGRKPRMSKTEAVMKTQKWWRQSTCFGRTTKRIMENFKSKGMTMDLAKSLGYAGLVDKVKEKEMMRVMSKAVLRVFYLSYGRKGTKKIADVSFPPSLSFIRSI
jgi:hypothetical protein